jgi:hypothetical protein
MRVASVRGINRDATCRGGEGLATRLDLGSAAVNEQFDPRDEAGVIRRQKQRDLGNFLRFSHASHRDGRHNPPNYVCRLAAHQRRIDRTRANDV